MARLLSDLRDVDIRNVQNNDILKYDSFDGKFRAYPIEQLFISFIEEGGELTEEFITYLNQALDQVLDERIDAIRLGDLLNVDDNSVLNNYVLMYDANTETYRTVNPDEVLIAAVQEETQPGLPDEFIDQLDEDLDNRIDVDAGEY